jgi:hypothetical protein
MRRLYGNNGIVGTQPDEPSSIDSARCEFVEESRRRERRRPDK